MGWQLGYRALPLAEAACLSRESGVSLLVMKVAGGAGFLNSPRLLAVQFHPETLLSKIGGLSFLG